MKYIPTIDLWDPAIAAALHYDQLKLQTGQWVKCGSSKPSRFVRVTKGRSLQAVHPRGADKVNNERFKEAIECWPR